MNHQQQHDTVGLNDLNEIARRLRALTRRYEDFFKLQFQRLDKHMRLQQDMISQADVVRRLMDDVQQQKQQWESDRIAELERISQASDKLMHAWTELENQQRQMLTSTGGNSTDATRIDQQGQAPASPQGMPHSGPTSANSVSNQPAPNTIPRGNPSTSQPTFQETGSHGNGVNGTNRPTYANPHVANSLTNPANSQTEKPVNSSVSPDQPPHQQSPELAQFEYEQLKRQMRQHANRQG